MKYLVTLLALTSAVSASAACVGTDPVKSCTDASGNIYTIATIGTSTYINGTTADGRKYSQETHRIGNTVQTFGTAANGRSWNSITTPVATYGTDQNGNGIYIRH